MNYTLHQLRVFLEVVRWESITKAAEEMHMTQPALSIQLKNFQMQFDMRLTEKIGRSLHVTDFGRSIAELAENVLNEADTIKYKTREYSGLLAGKLRISSASTGKYVIPYFLNSFMRQYQGIDLRLDVSNKTLVVKNLIENKLDFALVSVLPKEVDVFEEKLMGNILFLVSNSLKMHQDKPLIFREKGSATRDAMERFFGNPNKRKSMELTSNEAVKQAAIAGLGNSIIPLLGIRNELLNKQLFIIPTKGLPITTHWRLVWLKQKKLSPIAKAFLEYIQSEKEKIIAKQFEWYLDFEKNNR